MMAKSVGLRPLIKEIDIEKETLPVRIFKDIPETVHNIETKDQSILAANWINDHIRRNPNTILFIAIKINESNWNKYDVPVITVGSDDFVFMLHMTRMNKIGDDWFDILNGRKCPTYVAGMKKMRMLEVISAGKIDGEECIDIGPRLTHLNIKASVTKVLNHVTYGTCSGFSYNFKYTNYYDRMNDDAVFHFAQKVLVWVMFIRMTNKMDIIWPTDDTNVINPVLIPSKKTTTVGPTMAASAEPTIINDVMTVLGGEMYQCRVCEIQICGITQVEQHLRGMKHQRRSNIEKVNISCDICKISVTGTENYQEHIKGKQHLSQVSRRKQQKT